MTDINTPPEGTTIKPLTEVAPGWYGGATPIPGTGKAKTGAQLDRDAATRRQAEREAAWPDLKKVGYKGPEGKGTSGNKG